MLHRCIFDVCIYIASLSEAAISGRGWKFSDTCNMYVWPSRIEIEMLFCCGSTAL